MTISPKELAAASLEAARQTGINARHFEKDYYVTEVLRQVFADLPDSVVFKGGTSLSKAYHLIDRFSEDIDLLVVPDPDTPGEVERILGQIDASSSAAMGGVVPTVRDAQPGLMREIGLAPSYGTPKGGGVGADVRVESGRRGGPRPTEVRLIRPWLADIITDLAGDEDFAEFEVTVLHPARTLVEKLFVVAGYGEKLASNPDERIGSRQARHFYDITRLLGDTSPAVGHLTISGDLTEIVRDSERITAQYYDPSSAPTHGSFADSIVFTDRSLDDRIEAALAKSCEDLCYPGTPTPSWADVVAAVTAHRTVLTVD